MPKTSTLSKVLPSARTCGYQDNEPSHKHSIQNVIFSGVTSRKIMGNVDPKMGCKIWTPFWGPPNCFFFPRAPNRGPDFRPHFGVHIARFFFGSVTPAKRSSPSRMLASRFVCFTSTLQELGRALLRVLVFGTLFWPHFGVQRQWFYPRERGWLQFRAWTRVGFLRGRLVVFSCSCFGWPFRCCLGRCFALCFCVVGCLAPGLDPCMVVLVPVS